MKTKILALGLSFLGNLWHTGAKAHDSLFSAANSANGTDAIVYIGNDPVAVPVYPGAIYFPLQIHVDKKFKLTLILAATDELLLLKSHLPNKKDGPSHSTTLIFPKWKTLTIKSLQNLRQRIVALFS